MAKVVAQNPGNPQARQLLAAATRRRRPEGRDRDAEEVVEYMPALAESLARYLEQDGQLKEAAAPTRWRLSQQPNNRQLKVSVSRRCYNAKDYAQAARFAGERRASSIRTMRTSRAVQARALFDAGDKAGAIAVAESAAKAFPKDAQTQFVLVDLYSDAGRSSEAEKLLRQMLANEPSNPRVLNHLGYLLATRGDQLDEAMTLVQRARQRSREAGIPRQPRLGHFKRGELNDAVKYLGRSRAEAARPFRDPGPPRRRARARGALQEAIAAWTQGAGRQRPGDREGGVEKKISDARSSRCRMQNERGA